MSPLETIEHLSTPRGKRKNHRRQTPHSPFKARILTCSISTPECDCQHIVASWYLPGIHREGSHIESHEGVGIIPPPRLVVSSRISYIGCCNTRPMAWVRGNWSILGRRPTHLGRIPSYPINSLQLHETERYQIILVSAEGEAEAEAEAALPHAFTQPV